MKNSSAGSPSAARNSVGVFFAAVFTPDATAAVASGMNTQTQGTPIVVYNPLEIAREDVVEAEVSLPPGTAGQAATKNKLYGAQPPSAATEESSQAEKISNDSSAEGELWKSAKKQDFLLVS